MLIEFDKFVVLLEEHADKLDTLDFDDAAATSGFEQSISIVKRLEGRVLSGTPPKCRRRAGATFTIEHPNVSGTFRVVNSKTMDIRSDGVYKFNPV